VSLRVAEQYIAAFSRLATRGTTLVLPANAGDAAGMVAQAMAVFRTVSGSTAAARGDLSEEAGNDDSEEVPEADKESVADFLASMGAGDVKSTSDPKLGGADDGSDGQAASKGFKPVDFYPVSSASAGAPSAPGASASPPAPESGGFVPKPF
jgi:hypothetical protein